MKSIGTMLSLIASKFKKQGDSFVKKWIWESIYDLFIYPQFGDTADPPEVFTAIPGGMYLGKYKQQHVQAAIYPYCVVLLDVENAKYTLCRETITNARVKFSLHDDSESAEIILDAGDKLKDRYDFCEFPSLATTEIAGGTTVTTNYQHVGMTREKDALIKRAQRWQYDIIYLLEYQCTIV